MSERTVTIEGVMSPDDIERTFAPLRKTGRKIGASPEGWDFSECNF